MKTWTEEDAANHLKVIVANAEGDELATAEDLFEYMSDRDLDIPQQGSEITPREVLNICREKHALWEKASMLLLTLLRDAGPSS